MLGPIAGLAWGAKDGCKVVLSEPAGSLRGSLAWGERVQFLTKLYIPKCKLVVRPRSLGDSYVSL